MTVIQRGMLWHFHIYMYYAPNLFINSIIFPPTPFTFLWCLQHISMFYNNACIEGTSTIFTFFTFIFYLPVPTSALHLTQPVLYSYPSFFRCVFIAQWKFCVGILLTNILFLILSPTSCAIQWFSVVSLCLVPIQMYCISLLFIIYHYAHFSSSLGLLEALFCTVPFSNENKQDLWHNSIFL
jgi:hypothetical protein